MYTCDGVNISPPVEFSDVPEFAKSLVLIMDDPDVPTNIRSDGMFDHWVMYDIASTLKGVAEGKFEGTQGVNGTGKTGYTGPCPPDREHRYFFRLYAIDIKLGLSKGKTKSEILEAMNGHIITTALLMGRYNRSRE
ncbi:MAG: YbhB and YbcL [Parcubacteria group bacterium GW2011_GWA2_47_7]|nr:MAG: YbhB and YbcL [Parcubacteria group bacterium GW2011_GWA2_47_7]